MISAPPRCSEPSSSTAQQLLLHSPRHGVCAHVSKIASCFISIPLFLPSSFFFFLIHFVFITAVNFSEHDTDSLSFPLCLVTMACNRDLVETMVTSHPLWHFCPAWYYGQMYQSSCINTSTRLLSSFILDKSTQMWTFSICFFRVAVAGVTRDPYFVLLSST